MRNFPQYLRFGVWRWAPRGLTLLTLTLSWRLTRDWSLSPPLPAQTLCPSPSVTSRDQCGPQLRPSLRSRPQPRPCGARQCPQTPPCCLQGVSTRHFHGERVCRDLYVPPLRQDKVFQSMSNSRVLELSTKLLPTLTPPHLEEAGQDLSRGKDSSRNGSRLTAMAPGGAPALLFTQGSLPQLQTRSGSLSQLPSTRTFHLSFRASLSRSWSR